MRLATINASLEWQMCEKSRWWLIHMMPMKRKLRRKLAKPGHCAASPCQNGNPAAGGFRSSTSKVAAMEKMPSEKASMRPVSPVIPNYEQNCSLRQEFFLCITDIELDCMVTKLAPYTIEHKGGRVATPQGSSPIMASVATAPSTATADPTLDRKS